MEAKIRGGGDNSLSVEKFNLDFCSPPLFFDNGFYMDKHM